MLHLSSSHFSFWVVGGSSAASKHLVLHHTDKCDDQTFDRLCTSYARHGPTPSSFHRPYNGPQTSHQHHRWCPLCFGLRPRFDPSTLRHLVEQNDLEFVEQIEVQRILRFGSSQRASSYQWFCKGPCTYHAVNTSKLSLSAECQTKIPYICSDRQPASNGQSVIKNE